jgi:hypothetical protein
MVIYAVTILFEHIAFKIMLPVSMSTTVFHSYFSARPGRGPAV